MIRVRKLLVSMCLIGGTAFAAPILVTNPGALGANDSVNWAQKGLDGTSLGASFTATSIGGVTVGASLTGPNSTISVVCPAISCSWDSGGGGGFNAGDSLIWTANGTPNPDGSPGANGPLTLSFSPVLGAGLFIQADAPGQFNAVIAAFNGAAFIGSFVAPSDFSGDPIFLGVLDSSSDITQIMVNLVSCSPNLGPCNNQDFAVDSLNLNTTTPTPEPSTLSLLLVAGIPAIRKLLSRPSPNDTENEGDN